MASDIAHLHLNMEAICSARKDLLKCLFRLRMHTGMALKQTSKNFFLIFIEHTVEEFITKLHERVFSIFSDDYNDLAEVCGLNMFDVQLFQSAIRLHAHISPHHNFIPRVFDRVNQKEQFL
jgi:hypothetical protein